MFKWIYARHDPACILPPWWYGYVMDDPLSHRTLYAVIPFNYLLRLGYYLLWQWNMLRGQPPPVELIERTVLDKILCNHATAYIAFPYEQRLTMHALNALIPIVQELGYPHVFTQDANTQLAAAGVPIRYRYDKMSGEVSVIDGRGEQAAPEFLPILSARSLPQAEEHW